MRKGNNIIMISEIYYSPVYSGVSKQLNLLDFSFKNSNIQRLKSVLNKNNELKENKLVKFIERTYYYVKIAINKYSNAFSNHLYSQHALFTILAMKIYTKSTYREIIDFIDVSDIIKKYLRIKKVPHFTTIQKFFKRLPSKQIREINQLILTLNDIKADIIALDGSGFTNDYADKYYAKIRQKERKSYIKNHLTIDVKTRLILYYQTSRGPKYDTQFAKQRNQTQKHNIQHLQNNLNLISETMDDYVGRLDQKGIISFVSSSIKRTLGYNPSEFLGKPIFEFIHPEDLEKTLKAFKECGNNKKSVL